MLSASLVITSIADDSNPVLRQYAADCKMHQVDFYVIGDSRSPGHFNLPGCRFYSLTQQAETVFTLSAKLPVNHYSRKNIGYLLAIRNGAEVIVESDDDNMPLDTFWLPHEKWVSAPVCMDSGWVNVFKYFTPQHIWPRGFPLELVNMVGAPVVSPIQSVFCPVQQGLVQQNPDVDAVYRLTQLLPVYFENKGKLILRKNAWSPFNSQHTIWFREAYPLLYLPSTCSFRMTDIWRSYVAQRIFWENDWGICYHPPSVVHERNEAILINDFRQEVSGYLNNFSIAAALDKLSLSRGVEHIAENMLKCYEALMAHSIIGKEELELLECWLMDIQA